jgi:hypothetical protein
MNQRAVRNFACVRLIQAVALFAQLLLQRLRFCAVRWENAAIPPEVPRGPWMSFPGREVNCHLARIRRILAHLWLLGLSWMDLLYPL